MFIYKVFLVSLGLLSGLIAAAPVFYQRFGDPDFSELIARNKPRYALKHVVQAVTIKNKIDHSLNPKKNQAIFWSGANKTPTGKFQSIATAAQRFAKLQKAQTINQALRASKIRIPPDEENPLSGQIWAHASKVWAEKASGKVEVALGTHVRTESVYKMIEKPTIMANDEVTKVTEHTLKTNEQKVVKGK